MQVILCIKEKWNLIERLQQISNFQKQQLKELKKSMEPNNFFTLDNLNPIAKESDLDVQPLPTQLPPSPLSNKITTIKLISTTWNKDSYGLFDYQAKQEQYYIQEENIQQSTFIVRDNKTGKTILVRDLNQKKSLSQLQTPQKGAFSLNKDEHTVLGQLIVDRSKLHPSFKLKVHKQSQNSSKISAFQVHSSQDNKKPIPFILADSTTPKSNGYPLKPGNIIKFGRVEYLVLESFNGKNTESFRDSIYLDDTDSIFDVFKHNEIKKLATTDAQNQSDSDNINCKICLCNEETEQDPLISPCLCKGYCGLIHTHCLKTWINNKVKKQTSGLTVSYNFTKFVCEICKAPFPKVVKTEVEQVEMMSIFKPQKPYIMLQSLDPLNNHVSNHNQSAISAQKQRLLHLISTDQKCSIKIGRANECQIRLMDISVSRRHAEINLVGSQFFIKDTGAKFGTLVEWNNISNSPKGDIISINRKKPLKIQLGRTAYQFIVQDINQDIDTQ